MKISPPFRDLRGCLSRVVVTLVILLYATAHVALAEKPHEDSVKAAILLNFARFTHWPPEGPSTGAPVELCVLGGGALAQAFEKIDGKKVKDRTLHVRFAERVEDIGACDILFLSRNFKGMLAGDFFSSLANRPVLTVGENPEFIESGGMINIFHKNERIRFEVNLAVIRQHGLKISSRLLKLAIIVGN